MLPRSQRLTTGAQFAHTIRRGKRAGGRRLVVYLHAPGAGEEAAPGVRAGFVVSRAVGDAVTRNTVQRRLRHLAREELASLPSGSRLVVRALPPAAGASSAVLRRDLRAQLARVCEPSPPAVRR